MSIGDIVLEKAPNNAKYTSPDIQKDVLNIISNQVRAKIRKEIGDAKFCILVDEARDASNKKQMAIVLRFVDTEGFLRERFFAIVHVTDTIAAILKKEISDALGRYDLHIHNMHRQRYDGASNMCDSWNGLQALFLKDCSATGERDTDRGCNQIGNLLRPGKTRWSSNFDSFCSMINMYSYVITVLENMVNDGAFNYIRGEASGALIAIKSFDFIFILHLMNKIMRITNLLYRALQEKSLDILSGIDYISMTKNLRI
ncbi:uncharacterized protein LOC142525793 [Primulina tabacum]|uniref:uncharacterized protein LOC142525793 n=1 Tax=Primulina tabacum TaxID=48773 RepID=UPI003F59DEB4